MQGFVCGNVRRWCGARQGGKAPLHPLPQALGQGLARRGTSRPPEPPVGYFQEDDVSDATHAGSRFAVQNLAAGANCEADRTIGHGRDSNVELMHGTGWEADDRAR